jgi:hypothetical protein
MTEQGSMPAPPTPLCQGGQTPVGDLPSAAVKIFSSPPRLKKGPISETLSLSVEGPVSVGGSVFGKGPICAERGVILSQTEIDLGVIRDAELGPTGTLIAQFLWAARDFIRRQGGVDRPLEAMSIEEIVGFVRGGRP